MAKIVVETAFNVAPDSTSGYQIFDAEDQWLVANATDGIFKYDGTGIGGLDGGAPKGNILAVYKDRLLVAGDSNFPHRIWYSHIRNAEGWSKKTNWLDVRPEDGGEINGLGVQGDELMISKNNGKLYGWRIYNDGAPENSRVRIIEDDKGQVNNKTAAVLEDTYYYLDRNQVDTIPRQFKGGLSYIIDQVVKGINSLDELSMGSNDRRVYVALGDIDIEVGDTVSLSDAVLVYDVPAAAWYIRDKIDAKAFARFIDSSNEERIYFGDSNGKVYKLEEGTLAGSDPIHMRIRTKPYLREQGQQITVKKVGIYMDDPDGTIVSYRTSLQHKFDNQLGQITKEPVQWFEVSASGGLFQLEFSHSNREARPTLNQVSIIYDVGGKHGD